MLLEYLEINPSYTIDYQYSRYKRVVNMASGDTAEYYISKERIKKISFKVGPLDNKDKSYINAFYMSHLSYIPFSFKNTIQRFNSPIKLEISSDERFYFGNISLTEFIPTLITYNVRIRHPKNPVKINNVYSRSNVKMAYNSVDENYYTEYVLNIYKSSDLIFPIHFVFVDEKNKIIIKPSKLFYSLNSYKDSKINIYLLMVHGNLFLSRNIIDFLLKTDFYDYFNNNFPYEALLIKENLDPKFVIKNYRSFYKQLKEKILYFPFKLENRKIIDPFGQNVLDSLPL